MKPKPRQAKETAKRGRPSSYDPAIAQQICDRLSEGEPLQWICKDDGMPSVRTVSDWTKTDDSRPEAVPATFSAEFAQARARGEDAIAADCLRIADTPLEGVEITTDEKGTTEKRGDMLGHRKLQIETRLKLLAKWNPKRYGDKVAVGGAEDLPPIKTDADPMDTARRVAFILQLGLKAKGTT